MVDGAGATMQQTGYHIAVRLDGVLRAGADARSRRLPGTGAIPHHHAAALTRRVLATAAAGLTLAAAGCDDDSVYSEGGDEATKRAARAVVRANLTALARGDAKTFCGSYTPKFLRTYHESYAACVSRFKPPNPRAPAPRIQWRGFLTASDTKVDVEFSVDGGNTQSYFLEYRRPVRQAGSTPRWLIDLETVARD